MSNTRQQAERMAARFEKKYGLNAGALGDKEYSRDVIPTGSLSLDYALGTGGWVCGHPIEVFGPPDIGKSSVLGSNAVRNAQQMGKFCVIIALEPGFDPKWAEKNGVKTSELLIARPDNGLEAFNMLAECIEGGAGFILFDSIGAVLREAEAEADGKPSQGGRSSLISWGATNVLMKAWKHGVGVMYLNQVRDVMGASHGGVYQSPGGHALKHSCAVRVQLMGGNSKLIKGKVDGEDLDIGREMTAVVVRNKLSEGGRRMAAFDWYGKETTERPVGIDAVDDMVNIAKRTGVIEGSTWLNHPAFPEKINGQPATVQFLRERPDVQEKIRQEVLAVMEDRFGQPLDVRPDLEVIEGQG